MAGGIQLFQKIKNAENERQGFGMNEFVKDLAKHRQINIFDQLNL